MTPAETLTLAAERLEALDAAATPGPWEATRTVRRAFVKSAIAELIVLDNNMDDADAAFIAAMRGVAAPLAAWLRNTAYAAKKGYAGPSEVADALTLAREVIRASGGED